MKQLLLSFIFILLTASTCQNNVDKVYNSTMVEYEDTLTKTQLDSLFIADSISFNVKNDWIEAWSLSESKTEMLYKYVYIKELTDSTGLIYTLTSYQDTLYIITKRITK